MYEIVDYVFDHTNVALDGPLALLAGVIHFVLS